MSRIDELIAELCPGGVPHRPLGEIGELVRGNGMPKTDFTESGVGAIHYGQIYTYYGTWATETISFVSPETAARLAKVDPGDVIITNTSENLEDVGKAVAWLGDEQIVTGGTQPSSSTPRMRSSSPTGFRLRSSSSRRSGWQAARRSSMYRPRHWGRSRYLSHPSRCSGRLCVY